MSALNRRNFMALAGTAAVAAGCSKVTPSGGTTGSGDPSTGDNFGDDPASGARAPLIAETYQLIIMRFTPDMKFDASHGSFAAPSKSSEPEVRAAVEAQIKSLARGGDVQSLKPLAGSDGVNFENWGFSSTRRIYVFMDSLTATFDTKRPLTFLDYSTDNLHNPEPKQQKTISPNKSFYNASAVESFAGRGSLLYFENHYLIDGANPIPPKQNPPIWYSMDFHLLVANARGTKRVPIVIDPGGGNGMGWTP